jgi:hypothetical protein
MSGEGDEMKLSNLRDGWEPAGRRWLRWWTVLTLPGALLALLELPLVVTCLVGILVFGLVARSVASSPGGNAATAATRDRSRAAAWIGGEVALISVGICGLLAFSLPLGMATVVAFIVTRPSTADPCRQTCEQNREKFRPAVATQRVLDSELDSPSVVTHLSGLSNAELCREWRRSFLVLQAATTAARRVHVVRVRQALLDELETRNPSGLRQWLQSGGRAASGPDRYMATSDGDGGHPNTFS